MTLRNSIEASWNFLSFRKDSPREICSVFEASLFEHAERRRRPKTRVKSVEKPNAARAYLIALNWGTPSSQLSRVRGQPDHPGNYLSEKRTVRGGQGRWKAVKASDLRFPLCRGGKQLLLIKNESA